MNTDTAEVTLTMDTEVHDRLKELVTLCDLSEGEVISHAIMYRLVCKRDKSSCTFSFVQMRHNPSEVRTSITLTMDTEVHDRLKELATLCDLSEGEALSDSILCLLARRKASLLTRVWFSTLGIWKNFVAGRQKGAVVMYVTFALLLTIYSSMNIYWWVCLPVNIFAWLLVVPSLVFIIDTNQNSTQAS